MRRRWPWIVFLSVSGLLAVGFSLLGRASTVPDEDGMAVIPLLRVPPPEVPALGPLPVAPLTLRDVTFRVSFRWLGAAPTPREAEAQLRASAKTHLEGFTVQPRPSRSWIRKFVREPLVASPGFEFAHVQLPRDYNLSHYETASSEFQSELASGQRPTGDEVIAFTPDLVIVDFHIRGAELIQRLRQVDAFVIDFAEKTNGRVKSDERSRQASAGEIRDRRLNRWFNGVPFGPSYTALASFRGRDRQSLLVTEQTKVLGLPDVWVWIPEGVLSPAAQHLLLAGALQRFVENPRPDEPGIVELDVHALKHPDLRAWATAALPVGAGGKVRLAATEMRTKGGRVVQLRPDGDARQLLCQFAGCELTASFGE